MVGMEERNEVRDAIYIFAVDESWRRERCRWRRMDGWRSNRMMDVPLMREVRGAGMGHVLVASRCMVESQTLIKVGRCSLHAEDAGCVAVLD